MHRVDQGPMNYRWKFGAGKWKWQRQLYKVHDASGDRLCGLVNPNRNHNLNPNPSPHPHPNPNLIPNPNPMLTHRIPTPNPNP